MHQLQGVSSIRPTSIKPSVDALNPRRELSARPRDTHKRSYAIPWLRTPSTVNSTGTYQHADIDLDNL